MVRRFAVLVAFALIAVSSAQVKVGAPAPEPGIEKVVSPAAAPVPTLASLRGKAVLIEFWGTWCGHCIQALPHLEKLHAKFAPRGVEFLAISDEREKLVLDFLKTTKIVGTVALDTDSSAFKAYSAEGLPKTILIDRKGNVAGITHPDFVTDDTLEDLLAGRPLRLNDTAKAETSKKPAAPALVELRIRISSGTDRAAGIGLNEMTGFGVTALDAIGFGFRTPENRVIVETELPKDYYDITAKGPEGTDVAYTMLEAALKTTLGVDIQRETRDLEVYVVRPIPGVEPKVEKAGSEKPSGGMSAKQAGGTNMNLRMLFSFLEFRGKRPSIDESGLKGLYNWSISSEANDFEGLRQALRDQLGLDLVREKRAMPVVVVRKPKPPQ